MTIDISKKIELSLISLLPRERLIVNKTVHDNILPRYKNTCHKNL